MELCQVGDGHTQSSNFYLLSVRYLEMPKHCLDFTFALGFLGPILNIAVPNPYVFPLGPGPSSADLILFISSDTTWLINVAANIIPTIRSIFDFIAAMLILVKMYPGRRYGRLIKFIGIEAFKDLMLEAISSDFLSTFNQTTRCRDIPSPKVMIVNTENRLHELIYAMIISMRKSLKDARVLRKVTMA
ncbi:hypothetical protein DFH07DRAFT_945144 [Mycena maculata]|uniref:Uncharacterized protein n=1 Tax=Mycena maculata TaxID=230809 RepID=A0AAD7HZG7_9AGAR|nr:hypothetical protein DFH07DRAFT_945144 [Mycena maculata]